MATLGNSRQTEHARELDEVIDALPLNEQHQELVGLSALLTVQPATDALLDILENDPPPQP